MSSKNSSLEYDYGAVLIQFWCIV